MKVEVLTLKSVRSISDTNLVSRLFPKARKRTLGTRLEFGKSGKNLACITKQGHRQPRIYSKARALIASHAGVFRGAPLKMPAWEARALSTQL